MLPNTFSMRFNLGQKSQPPAITSGCVLELLLLRKTEEELFMIWFLKWIQIIVYCLMAFLWGGGDSWREKINFYSPVNSGLTHATQLSLAGLWNSSGTKRDKTAEQGLTRLSGPGVTSVVTAFFWSEFYWVSKSRYFFSREIRRSRFD